MGHQCWGDAKPSFPWWLRHQAVRQWLYHDLKIQTLHPSQTEGCNYINKRSCDKRRRLEWVYSLFSAYASALKGNRRMVLLAGSLAHTLIFYPHTDMCHTCSAFLNIEGKTREASSLPSNDDLTWVSGTLHKHHHRLEGWIKGRKKINVKHTPNETQEREKQFHVRTL